MNAHPIRWRAPQPLWARFGGASAADEARPAILRFASDDFMDQMLATLARDPARVDRLVARPESWRAPMTESVDLIERTPLPRIAQSAARKTTAAQPKAAVSASAPLKLYQPAHQRFYLVGASLVCAQPGLPERAVVQGGSEQVNFVIRRLLPATPGSTNPDDLREFAYVKDAQGARWQRAASGTDAADPVAGEELLPVFPLVFQDDDEKPRTLWSGLVPVGRREEYLAATVDRSAVTAFAAAQRASLAAATPTKPNSKQARVAQFQMEVAEPWKNLIRSCVKAGKTNTEGVTIGSETEPVSLTDGKRKRVYELNLQQQNTSWLILLDFADYLEAHLTDLWNTIQGNGAGYADLSTHRQNLYDWLGTAVMGAGLQTALKATDASADTRPPATHLREALKAIRATGVRERLEATQLSYTSASASLSSTDWPPFHFVLAGLDTNGAGVGPYKQLAAIPGSSTSTEFSPDPAAPDSAPEARDVDRLTAIVGRALEATQESNAPPVPFALQMKNALSANIGDAGWFVVRFVHQRRDCGPLHPPTLSAPTQRFQLAGFFDSDAPARPIRIALPLDTSPAGLRKFNKNTAFMLSDMLCGQVQRAKGLGLVDLVRSVLPWPLHKALDAGSGEACTDSGSFSLGMICSISIPIITICALFLLIIMVSLLDILFRWLPYFVICFPVPKFKGKS